MSYKLGVNANMYYLIDEEVGEVYSFNRLGVCVGERINMMLAKTSVKTMQEVTFISLLGSMASQETDIFVTGIGAATVKEPVSMVARKIERSMLPRLLPFVPRIKRRDAPGVLQYLYAIRLGAVNPESLKRIINAENWRSL